MHLLAPLFIILILYPYFISKKINKHTPSTNKTQILKITNSISTICLISLMTIFIVLFLLRIYENLIPDTNSNLCTNLGGWSYTCKGDSEIAPIILFLLGIVISTHHFIIQKFIYNIFKYSKGIFKYIYMYIHMAITYFLTLWLSLILYGLFTEIYYDSKIIELLRFLVALAPTLLFIISTYIYTHKNKNN